MNFPDTHSIQPTIVDRPLKLIPRLPEGARLFFLVLACLIPHFSLAQRVAELNHYPTLEIELLMITAEFSPPILNSLKVKWHPDESGNTTISLHFRKENAQMDPTKESGPLKKFKADPKLQEIRTIFSLARTISENYEFPNMNALHRENEILWQCRFDNGSGGVLSLNGGEETQLKPWNSFRELWLHLSSLFTEEEQKDIPKP